MLAAVGVKRLAGARVAGRYRLERRLGQGGMGEVWAAHHTITGKRVALKLLAPAIQLSPVARRRLMREARFASRLDHPHVVAVHDLFFDGDEPVLAMELLEGETLGAFLAREAPVPFARAARLLAELVSAVGAAHERGIVHRDLKPANIFLTTAGGVKVLDFGVARLCEPGESGDTVAGQLIGTPRYMAPEQHRGVGDIDHRADLWAIAVMTYELLSGRRPFEGDNVADITEWLATRGVTPLRALAPSAPFELAIEARRMLERDRARRPPDLRGLAAILGKPIDGACAATPVPVFGAPRSNPLAPETFDEETEAQITTLAPAHAARPTRRGWVAAAGVVAFGALAWLAGRADTSRAEPASSAPTSPPVESPPQSLEPAESPPPIASTGPFAAPPRIEAAPAASARRPAARAARPLRVAPPPPSTAPPPVPPEASRARPVGLIERAPF
jgi:eukaryotic-like serine/threonine-protein kinase